MGIEYDKVALYYDSFYDNQSSKEENSFIYYKLCNIIKSKNSVGDLGCGTGLLIDIFGIDLLPRYTGIDISANMLKVLLSKYPDANVQCFDLDLLTLNNYDKFDLIVSLFGSISYLSSHTVQNIIRMADRNGIDYFFMFYKKGYKSKILSNEGIDVPLLGVESLVLDNSNKIEWSNYVIVTNLF